MIYRRNLRPLPYYERRRMQQAAAQEVAFQPVEDLPAFGSDEIKLNNTEDLHMPQEESRASAPSDFLSESPGTTDSPRQRAGEYRNLRLFKVFNINFFLDDLILLGLIFILFQEKMEDEFFIFILLFLFIIGKE